MLSKPVLYATGIWLTLATKMGSFPFSWSKATLSSNQTRSAQFLYRLTALGHVLFVIMYAAGLARTWRLLPLQATIFHAGFLILLFFGLAFLSLNRTLRLTFSDYVNKLLQTNDLLQNEFRHDPAPNVKFLEWFLFIFLTSSTLNPAALFLFLVRPDGAENMYYFWAPEALAAFQGADADPAVDAPGTKLFFALVAALVTTQIETLLIAYMVIAIDSAILMSGWTQTLIGRSYLPLVDSNGGLRDALSTLRAFRVHFTSYVNPDLFGLVMPVLNAWWVIGAIFCLATLTIFNTRLDSQLALILIELAVLMVGGLSIQFRVLQTITSDAERILQSIREKCLSLKDAVGQKETRSVRPILFRLGPFFVINATRCLLVLDLIIANVIAIVFAFRGIST